jgi:hypothetical protein
MKVGIFSHQNQNIMQRSLTFIGIFLAFIIFGSQAQEMEVVHFHKIKQVDKADLYARYPHFDEISFPAIPNAEEKHKILEDEWHRLWGGFIDYYHSKGLYPDKKHTLEVCLHFDEEGKINYFGYAFRKDTAFSEKFVNHFKDYAKTFVFKVKSGIKFSKCGRLDIKAQKNPPAPQK